MKPIAILTFFLFFTGFSNADPKRELVKSLQIPDHELVLIGSKMGIDFPKLIENCLNDKGHDKLRAWKLLVWFRLNAPIDGAAAEVDTFEVLSKLLVTNKLELEKFYSSIPKDHARMFPIELLKRFRYDDLTQEEKSTMKRDYPLLFLRIEGVAKTRGK